MRNHAIMFGMVLSTCTACSHDNGPQASDSGETSSSSSSTGSETSTAETSSTDTSGSETTGEDCLEVADICRGQAIGQWNDCKADCNDPMRDCKDEQCRWSCDATLETQLLACAETYCPNGYEPQPCEVDCHAQAAACSNEPSCEFFACSFAEVQCMDSCNPCEWVRLLIPYAGSCVLVLPGSAPPIKRVFTLIDADQLNADVVTPDLTCDMPDVLARWTDDNYDHIELCSSLCDAFTQAGELVLAFASPPCE